MATVHYTAFLAIILVLQSHIATAADVSIPVISPFSGEACRENVCGQGNCFPSNNSPFGFECVCRPGWKQAPSQADQNLKFLPCVIPDCKLNYACGNAPYRTPPYRVPDNRNRANFSSFDPCLWIDCGGGTCRATSQFTHTCECQWSYYNLLNDRAFPCYKQCAFGVDCPNVGPNFQRTSTSFSDQNPSLTGNISSNAAASLIPRAEFGCLITVATTLAGVLWKYT